MNRIINALNAVSDQGNTIFSKLFVYVGVSGSSVGVASGIAKNTTELSTDLLTLSEWGSICGIIGGLTLAIKSGSDIYFNRKKEQRENELFKQKMKETGAE